MDKKIKQLLLSDNEKNYLLAVNIAGIPKVLEIILKLIESGECSETSHEIYNPTTQGFDIVSEKHPNFHIIRTLVSIGIITIEFRRYSNNLEFEYYLTDSTVTLIDTYEEELIKQNIEKRLNDKVNELTN
jgi:hypothetical protein